MRSLVGFVGHKHSVLSRVSGIADQNLLSEGNANRRISPIICDQRLSRRVTLQPDQEITVDLTPLELTTGLNMLSTGAFRFQLGLTSQSKNQDRQTLSEAIFDWAKDETGVLTAPWFYCAKQCSFFGGSSFQRYGAFYLDPDTEPTFNNHSLVTIDFNQITLNWDDPPTDAIIRISAILHSSHVGRMDLELYGRDYEDKAARVFKIHKNEEGQTESAAYRTAKSFHEVFLFNQLSNISLTEAPHPRINNSYLQPGGTVAIWTRVTQPGPDLQKVHSTLSTYGELQIKVNTNPTAGHSFTLDVPMLKFNKYYPDLFPVTFTATASNPDIRVGQYLIGGTASETAENLLQTIKYMIAKGNSKHNLYTYLASTATRNGDTLHLVPYWKGRFGLYAVDNNQVKHEMTVPNGNVINHNPYGDGNQHLVQMDVRGIGFPFMEGDILTLSGVEFEADEGGFIEGAVPSTAYNGSWVITRVNRDAFLKPISVEFNLDPHSPPPKWDPANVLFSQDESGDVIVGSNDNDNVTIAIVPSALRHNTSFDGVNSSTISFKQFYGKDGEDRYEGDILVSVYDNNLESGWRHPKHHYTGSYYSVTEQETIEKPWDELTEVQKREYINQGSTVPRFGIEENGFLPWVDRGRFNLGGSAEHLDPAIHYYFKENDRYQIQWTAQKRFYKSYKEEPYLGRHPSAKGISIRLGYDQDYRYGPFGGSVKAGGTATALILAPHSGENIYIKPPVGNTNVLEYATVFQLVNFFVLPSTYYPDYCSVPIGFTQQETIDNLTSAIKQVYSKFQIRVDQRDLGIKLFHNDRTLSFEDSRWSLDYAAPIFNSKAESSSLYDLERRHIIAVKLHNPGLVDITVDLLSIGQRLHPRGWYEESIKK